MNDFLSMWRSGLRPGYPSVAVLVARSFNKGMLNLVLFGRVDRISESKRKPS